MIRGAGEGASAENEKIAAMMEEIGNGGPGRFGNHGPLRKDEQARLRIS